MRKLALVLGELERFLLAGRDRGLGEGLRPYLAELAGLLLHEKEAPSPVREAAEAARSAAQGSSGEEELLRALDALRHALLRATGQAPADWDLIDPCTGQPDPGSRQVNLGLKAYLEDLRSPFNVGSIFRTADAFGLEELVLSPSCADPLHPRSLRSAMGAVELLPWRRASLEEEAGEGPLFALELGGTPIDSFDFPERGMVVIGSEELGISRQSRALCQFGTVSIAMSGAKASLNVAVAFGILMHEWRSSLGSPPHLV